MTSWFDKELDLLDAQLADGELSEHEYNVITRDLRRAFLEDRRDRLNKMMQDYEDRY